MQQELSDARGDTAEIDDLLQTELEKIGTDATGWTVFYQQRGTQEIWKLSYPQREMHGGSLRLLRKLGAKSRD